jgi:outer membrane protein OmpA-like peptidoglycan-associated protein
MTNNIAHTIIAVLLCVAATPARTAAQCTGTPGEDRDGKDNPLVSRYPGSCIYGYQQVEFEEFTLPLGKNVGGKFTKSQHLEGKITNIEYNIPEHRSILEVFRNYQQGLKQGGFETLYTCAAPECTSGDIGNSQPLYDGGGDRWEPPWDDAHLRYLSAKLARAEGDVYVALSVSSGVPDRALLYIIEVKPMESGLVTVDAAALASDITRTGHSAVYGIYFDTGKADIKPESDAALKEITKLLQQDPKLKLYVVGHTDNVGALASNMDLSKRRADAVAKALMTKYQIAAARLNAQGDGPLAPVASNDSEDGRAKNRRVELVKQ